MDPKLKAEYKKNSHVRSMPLYAVDPKYYDLAEVNRQAELWSGPNNKHPWYDAPATVKVNSKISKQNHNTRGILLELRKN